MFQCPNGRGVIVMRGCIRNLDELLATSSFFRGDNTTVPNSPVARHNWFKGDSSLVSAEAILHMYLCSRGSPIVFLSELEGHYSFVIYDADRQQVFAARDYTGKEPLVSIRRGRV